jgi:Flp pilus assembly protein TadG
MQDRRGGVAPIFAIAIIPVFGLVGAAVDYSRANAIRAGMQSAIDATALAMAKLAPTLTKAELDQKSNDYFKAMFNQPEAKNVVITPNYTTAGGSQLNISVSGSMDTSFMKLMGFSSLNIGSNSTVKWGNSRLRVALALDNTGSMSDDGKMTALKDATNKLLTQLKNAATNSADVYVSIIPFSKDVNVDSDNKSANWIDWTDWNANNGTCKDYNGRNEPGSESSCENAGLNTENRWYRDQSSIDTRQQMTCDNINAANITLYTIHVNTGGDPFSNLLKNCAGTAPAPNVLRKYPDPDKNFVVTSSSGIGTVFNQIGTNLSKLRIAK